MDKYSRIVKSWVLLAVGVGSSVIGIWVGIVAEQTVAKHKSRAMEY